MGLMNLFQNRPKTPVIVQTEDLAYFKSMLPTEAYNALLLYFKTYYNLNKHYGTIATSSIIENHMQNFGEFPSSGETKFLIDLDKKMKRSAMGSGDILSFEIVDCKLFDENEVLVMTTRTHDEGVRTTLGYILKKKEGKWLICHRVLFSGGKVVKKFSGENYICYTIENPQGTSIAPYFDYRPDRNPNVNIGDKVKILCRYNSEGLTKNDFSVNIVTITKE